MKKRKKYLNETTLFTFCRYFGNSKTDSFEFFSVANKLKLKIQ